MKRFLYKIGVLGLIAFVLLNGIAFLSLHFLGNSCLFKPQYLENGVKEKQFDYLVLGSSTGLTTLNTKEIDSLTGKNGLNMSMDDTSMSTHYLMLQHYYALGKKTDKVVLTVTPWDAVDSLPELGNNDYRFITRAGDDYVHQYYSSMEKGVFKPLASSAFFPLAGVSYYNAEVFFPSLLTVFQPEKRNRFDDRGNYTYPESNLALVKKTPADITVSIKNPFFKKIQNLCESNDSRLIVYIAPLYKQNVIVMTNGITLINHSNLLKDSKLFYDAIHVNFQGRSICSKEFSVFLN